MLVSREAGGAALRYRVVYRKGPAVRFLGHLDLTNVIVRALLAAGVRLQYSEGYKPHPRVSFGPPLPLGVAGERELFDMVLAAGGSPDLAAVNRFLPMDTELREARMSLAKPVSLSAAMTAARYRFTALAGSADDLADRVAALLSAQAVTVRIEKKGETVTRDIRPQILALAVSEQPGSFEALLSAAPGNTCPPGVLLTALLPGHALLDYFVVRLACFTGEPNNLTEL